MAQFLMMAPIHELSPEIWVIETLNLVTNYITTVFENLDAYFMHVSWTISKAED